MRATLLALLPAAIFAILAGLDVLGPVARWNHGISVWLQGPSQTAITAFSSLDEWVFSGEVVLGVAFVAIAFLLMQRRWFIATSLAAIFPVVGVEVVVKYLMHQQPASTYLHIRKLFPMPEGVPAALEHGFPSGHASRIVFMIGWLAIVLTPARYRPAAGVLACLLAFFLCWTRIYAGDHSLLEIMAGIVLAVMFLIPAAIVRFLERDPRASRPPAR